ncbi:hypothetical protein LTR17_011146 [Elasticomyces elasticus]|nr:hypothetical protein LTR17_011146 [Elasticomyces elasticus]
MAPFPISRVCPSKHVGSQTQRAMVNLTPILCCADVNPTDAATISLPVEPDYRAFVTFAARSGTAVDTDKMTPNPNQIQGLGDDGELSHFIICRRYVVRRTSDGAGLEDSARWDETVRYWSAYTSRPGESTPVYRYLEVEWEDRKKLGEDRVGSKMEYQCEEHGKTYEMTVLRRVS